MNINLDYYKVFYSVASNESITRAANELMISQPAVSKVIKTLEDQLGTKLFIRKRDGVSLTEAGETIYFKIKEAMELISSAEEDVKSLTNLESGTINIDASNTILHEYLMKYITDFNKRYPNINIRIYTDKRSDAIRKAEAGLIDIIFTNTPYDFPSYFKEEKLMSLHDILVATDKYSYLKDKVINKKELESLPLLVLTKGTITRNLLEDYALLNNIKINPKMEFGSNSVIKEFTLAGFGIGMLTKEHVTNELKSGKLFELNIKLPLKEKYLSMVYPSNREHSIISKTFIDFIKSN